MENNEFRNKTVLITGATRGIGKSIAKYFVNCGANTVTVARSDMDSSIKTTHIKTDVRNTDEILSYIDNHNIDVDILINNAGISSTKAIGDESIENIKDIFDVNLFAVINLSNEISRRMVASDKKGVIINALSYATFIPSVNSGIYAASKAALASITKTMAAELAPFGIRVNGYSPGVIDTEMNSERIHKYKDQLINAIALHKIGQPDDVVEAVAFLASDRSSYITGINLDISGGKFIVQNSADVWK